MLLDIAKNKERIKNIFLYTLFWGIISHGMMIFNKINVHDEIGFLFDIAPNWSIILGRWFGAFLMSFDRLLFGFGVFSSATFYGGICLFSLAIIVILLTNMFNIQRKTELFLLTGIAVSSPVILMLFGYAHFIPFYFPSIILPLIGCIIICKNNKNFKNYLIGITLITLGIGVYQCYLAMSLTVLLIYLIFEVLENELSWSCFIKKLLYYLGAVVFAIILYLIINFIVLKVTRSSLTSYAGLDHLGFSGFIEYLKRTKKAYMLFLFPPSIGTSSIFPYNSRNIYIIILWFVITWSLIQFIMLLKNEKKRGFQFIILMMAYPMCVNFMYILSPNGVHALHLFTHVCSFVFLFYVLDHMPKRPSDKLFVFIKNATLLLVFFMAIIFVRYDNLCYVEVDMAEQQARSWFSTLKTRIETVPGYDDSLPLMYINEYDKKDNNIGKFIINEAISTYPYFPVKIIINDYCWRQCMKVYIGYDPIVIDNKKIDKKYIDAMPSYPDDGAIKIIDNTIVVKF